MLHRDVAQRCCTEMLHRDVAQRCCTEMLHRDVAHRDESLLSRTYGVRGMQLFSENWKFIKKQLSIYDDIPYL